MVAPVASPGDERNDASPIFKRHLSAARIQLVELMQRINFGRIERLPIVNGEPLLTAIGKAVSTHKLKGENGPRPELEAADFPLKQDVVELCRLLDEIGDGEVELIEVKHGLPFLVEVSCRVEGLEVPA